MKYLITIILILSLSACVSGKSNIDNIISIPLIASDDVVAPSMTPYLKKSLTRKIIPVDENDPRYSYPGEGGWYEDPADSSDEEYIKYMKTLDADLIPQFP